MTPVPEAFYPRKSSPPDPLARPLSTRACIVLLELMAAAVLALFVVQFARGFLHEHHAAVARADAPWPGRTPPSGSLR